MHVTCLFITCALISTAGIPFIFVAVGLGALHEEYGVKGSSSGSDDYYK